PRDAERYAELGAPRISTTGNLKLDAPPPPVDGPALAALAQAIGRRPIVAATSTHAGEEAALIEVHQKLRGSFSRLLTIVAPRHPERGAGIADLAVAAGLRVAQRSTGAVPSATTDVYIVDTLGELG